MFKSYSVFISLIIHNNNTNHFHIIFLIGTCVEFTLSDYQALELANVTLVLSGEVIPQSFNVTVIAAACMSSSAPATG